MHLLRVASSRYVAVLRPCMSQFGSYGSLQIPRTSAKLDLTRFEANRRLSSSAATVASIGDGVESASALAFSSSPAVDLAASGVGGNSPVGLIQEYVVWLHSSMGLPWWASAAVLALSMRVALLPLQIMATSGGSYLALSSNRIEKLKEGYDRAITLQETRQTGSDMQALQQQMKLHRAPWTFAYLVVASSMQCLSLYSLHALSTAPEMASSLSSGGFWWVSNLAAGDPFYVLPVSCVVLGIAMNRMSVEKGVPQALHRVGIIFYSLSVNMVLGQASTALVQLYWLYNAVAHVLTARVLQLRPVAKALDIPDISPVLKEHTFAPLLQGTFTTHTLPPMEELRELADKQQREALGTGKFSTEPALLGRIVNTKPTKVLMSTSKRQRRRIRSLQHISVSMV